MQPALAGLHVGESANHALLGPSASNLRLARFSVEPFFYACLCEVRIMRRSLRSTFGTLYMSFASALTWDIVVASSSLRNACALGGRFFHA